MSKKTIADYFKKEYERTHDKKRKEYYERMYFNTTGQYLNKKVKKIKKDTVGKPVKSTKLNREFQSAYEASKFINRSGGYVGNILNGRVKQNPYGFVYI